ncbi:ANK ankyrin repeat protein [Aspergillus parasiticus SU-1]|uniref:ANK ankyrin repeat protein n=1 Tax=Aspergillus parasiticus (strain ATCC 56775 / NRRL 5862 / SRRC 143 / SU-1) TaxID=1403190 RepID=A0A0F0I1A5_ASPPU|nr:ANK ankyrin repeat protein [Aspergillus parasiticus SU-1]
MRLLHTEESHTGNFEIIEFTDDRIPPYAILSHTWEGGEVTFQDMQADQLHTRQKKGYSKIQRCCHLAKSEGFDYVWIDSCCIDKTSSAELSEAINSMYRWYQEAEVCYAYLADVPSKGFKESKWFTRGWTLQELIAPTKLTFLDENWRGLGSKADLQQAISECTRIPIGVLSGEEDIESFSIAQRMSWAAERVTTRVEDRAYSLLGIFGVNIPLIYGERETAFIRLQEEIMRISDDHSLFAWRSPDNRGGLLATSPLAFIGSHNIVRFNPFDAFNVPFAATSTGIDLAVRFMGIGPRGLGLAILHCKEEGEGDRLIALYVRDSKYLTMERFERVHSEGFKQLDLRKYRPSQYPMRQMIIQAGRLARHRKSKGCGKCDNITPEIYSDATLMTLMAFEEPSALKQAAERGLEDIVWLLLTRSDVEGDCRGPGGLTPLMHASRNGHERVAKMLVARRDVIADSTDDERRTPLWWAAEAGHEAIVKMLVEKGTAIEFRDRDGWTPLTIALKNGHEGTVGLLLDKGAALDRQNPVGNTPLLLAAWNGYENIVRVLLERGANIEAQNRYGSTPLLAAVGRGYEAIVRVLLEKGANVETQDWQGRTPLFLAAWEGYENIVRVLLEKGAVVEARDRSGKTPLLGAADRKHEAVGRVLLENGADIEARDKQNETALFLAVRKGHIAIVNLLLQHDAEANICNSSGRTPMAIAKLEG